MIDLKLRLNFELAISIVLFMVFAVMMITVPNTYAEEQSQALEEVVVTARKRSENIQEVGMSVSAYSQLELENAYSTDLRDLVNISPNLIIDDTAQGPGGVAAIYIRGIGVSDVEKNFDPAVGVVIDGVFIGSNSGGILRSIDLEGMEVLRGPQGTLFGRNSIAGVLNLRRSKPTGELGGKLQVSTGAYDTIGMSGLVNVGLSDNVALKLSATKRDQKEGFYNNLVTGTDEGRIDYQSVGANFLFSVSDALEIEYTYQQEETDQDTPPLLNVSQPGSLFCDLMNYCSPSLKTPYSGGRYKSTTNFMGPAGSAFDPATHNFVGPADATFDADTHILEAHWQLSDGYQLDYIYGSWETEETVLTDWDGLPAILFHTTRPAEYEQASHEFRLTSTSDGPFNFVLGAYLWESEYEIRLRSYIGFIVPGVVFDIPQTTIQETDSWAVFFEGDYAINDDLTVTFGGRYTEDEKSTDQKGNVNTIVDPEESWSEFTPKLGLTYSLSEDAMLYFTYSAGFRSGGFNGRVGSLEEAEQPYDQETVDNYEFGFKSEWMDNRLRFNGALFRMDYNDKQEEIQLPSTTSGTGQKTVVKNAATATMQGVEFELVAYPADGFNVRANLGLLDAEYDKFQFEGPSGTVDNSNLDIRRAPDVTFSLEGTYEWGAAGGLMWARAGYHYIGSHEVDFGNAPELGNDEQHLFDASVNYEINNTLISIYGRNLTQEDGYSIGFNVANLWSYAAPRQPRTWGIEISHRFGD